MTENVSVRRDYRCTRRFSDDRVFSAVVHGDAQAAALTPAWMAGIGVGVFLLVDAIQKAMFEKNKQ